MATRRCVGRINAPSTALPRHVAVSVVLLGRQVLGQMADLSERVRASLAGRYTIERELGRGGMATVYLARDLKHDRSVALKVLLPELAAVLGGERVLREIRLTAQIQPPPNLTLLHSGEEDGLLYFVVPYLRGE